MKTSDFYFDLPEELIAQEPLADRASSRLMVVHKDSGKREHRADNQTLLYHNHAAHSVPPYHAN